MLAVIDAVIAGRWFQKPSPFHCFVEKGHPKLCVITGPNTSGKSLLRKVLHNHYADLKMEYMSLSQEQRCASGGIGCLFLYGAESDESTGYNSVKTLLKAIQTGQSREKPFAIMLDEPEIGCSDETQAGIGLKIAEQIDTMPNLHSWYLITHSRQLVKHLLQKVKPTHWCLDQNGMCLEQWVQREVIPTNLNEMIALSKEKWAAVQAMMKK